MAQLGVQYDPRNYEPQRAFEPLPRGDYDVMVVSTAVTPTKANDGSFLEVELEVQTGPHAHRKVFDRITLQNRNVQAQEIGQRQLSGLCHAVGWLQALTDSDVLHGKTCRVRVGIEKGDGQYQDKNKVSAYIAPGAVQNGQQQRASPPANTNSSPPAKATASAGKKPWE